MSRCRVVVLVSGRGSNLQSIIDHAGGALPIELAAVISNRPRAPALARAERAEVPTAVVPHRGMASREVFDQHLSEAIDRERPDLVVLAGFMRLLTPAFVEHYEGRLINIHPSLLPKFPGLDTHARAIAAKEREHGASVHFVSAGMDEGPLIAQARVPIEPDDDPERLALRVLDVEHRLLPQCILWFAQGRLTLAHGQAWLDGRPALEVSDLRDF